MVRFSRAAAEARTATEILALLADATLEHGLAEAAAVFRIDEDDRATIAVARNLPLSVRGLAIDSDELGELGLRLRALVVNELPFVATLPLVAGGDLYGILALFGTSAERDDAADHLTEAIVDLAAVAVSKAIQFEELERSLAELRASRQALTRSEKLRAMGGMAAGISHDLRNILNPLSLQVQLLQRQCRDAPVVEILERMREALRFGVEVVERLRTFSRQEVEAHAEKIELATIAAQAAEIWRPRLAQSRGLELVLELAPAPPVQVRAGELANALVNLLVNAADAIQNSGSNRGRIALRSGAADGGSWVQVEDDGPGMPPDVERRVFEPFFTTKADGTGLGLAMVYAFVQRHGGRLELETAEGAGTRIRLWFPAA